MFVYSPHWFFLVPLLFLLFWYFRQFGLGKPLRALAASLLICALLDLSVPLKSSALDLWVLVDRSKSAENEIGSNLSEWTSILERSKQSDDRIHYIEFAEAASYSRKIFEGQFEEKGLESRIGLALRSALARQDSRRSNRILLLSDGFSTDPYEGDLLDRLKETESPLDYRLTRNSLIGDYRIGKIRSPSRVQRGEGFLVQVPVLASDVNFTSGSKSSNATLDIYRNGALLKNVPVKLKNGRALVKLSERLDRKYKGVAHYRVVLKNENDPLPGNNWSEFWVEQEGPKEILLVSYDKNDPLKISLNEQGVPFDHVSETSALNSASLSGKALVVINNVGAASLPESFLKALEFYVVHQGGGLLMTGGQNSYASGGYFNSPIDELLPVSMKIPEESWKQSAALVYVLDRSGSMGVTVSGHMGGMTKMDLANEGTAKSIALLGPKDDVAISAVDTKSHIVAPLLEVGSNLSKLMSSARSINSQGGGIYVYTGLNDAWKMLKKSKKKIKHIVLFADANDAEEPGKYEDLLKSIRKVGGSVSVIALGKRGDSDAQFLEDVAKAGDGRIFFVSNAVDLPGVFSQETVAVTRSNFIKEKTGLKPEYGWSEISSFKPNWLGAIDGYNQNFPRKKATHVLRAKDEHKSPLLSVWQKGLGRVAALSFPISGEYGRSFRAWSGSGNVLHTLLKWLRSPEHNGGLSLRHNALGSELFLDLYYSDEWSDKVAKNPPKLLLSDSGDSRVRNIPWKRLVPGHFRVNLELPRDEALRGVVQVGKETLPFGPISIGRDVEWSFDQDQVRRLKKLSVDSGGREVVDLEQVWSAPRQVREIFLRSYFLLAFLCVFLLEAFLSRVDREVDWPSFAGKDYGSWISKKPSSGTGESRSKAYDRKIGSESQKKVNVEPDSSDPDSQKRKSRYDKAKGRGL